MATFSAGMRKIQDDLEHLVVPESNKLLKKKKKKMFYSPGHHRPCFFVPLANVSSLLCWFPLISLILYTLECPRAQSLDFFLFSIFKSLPDDLFQFCGFKYYLQIPIFISQLDLFPDPRIVCTVMSHLRTGIHSEKCLIGDFVIVRTW